MSKSIRIVVVVILLLGAAWTQYQEVQDGKSADKDNSAQVIQKLYDDRQSDTWVQIKGTVQKLLADDLIGSKHQKFLLSLSNGHTLLISHNIDLAPRVPIEVGNEIELRGEYEWNDKGGVVHWTHHDPSGRKEGGWIEVNDKIYR